MTAGMSIIIASAPDRERVFAELYYNDEGWGIVSQEGGPLMLEIYSNPNLVPMKFELEDLIKILQEAKHKLRGAMP